MARTANKPFGDNLRELLVFKLQSLLDIEDEMIKSLQKMDKAATDPDLKTALQRHVGETENQLRRVEKALVSMGAAAKKTKCAGIRGLEEDVSVFIKNIKNEHARDAALVSAGQAAEHLEIAGYRVAKGWAEALNNTEIAGLLQETLQEEEAASVKLTELANNGINERAKNTDEPLSRQSLSQ